MVFSSLVFLFLFLPLFLAVYYLTPFKGRSFIILAGSYIFYAWWRIDFLALFAGVTLWNYVTAKYIIANYARMDRARQFMQIGVIGNLLTLALFKYFNFGIDSINALMNQSGFNTIEALRFVLPVGISFHIFQSISFLIDIYRKDAPIPDNFMNFAAYNSYYPQLIAGPVLRYKDLADQFTQRTHTFDKFSQGAYRFMLGFAKKVLIADTVAGLADATFVLSDPSMADAWLGALAYTVQLYFDFSGYSDMAIGLALMTGFNFMENFKFPYISRSITEFWRRWHISLSTWLRDYLYIPLGGNRKGSVRTYINLWLTMLLGGFWHGANWTFVIWGAWHGTILAIERAGGVDPARSRTLRDMVPMIMTLLFVILGWVMFRAKNVGQAMDFYKAMFGFSSIPLSDSLNWQITGTGLSAMLTGFILIYAVPILQARTGVNLKLTRNPFVHIATIVLFLLAVIKLTAEDYSPFLYFQF